MPLDRIDVREELENLGVKYGKYGFAVSLLNTILLLCILFL